jgi:hypothetical protein
VRKLTISKNETSGKTWIKLNSDEITVKKWYFSSSAKQMDSIA